MLYTEQIGYVIHLDLAPDHKLKAMIQFTIIMNHVTNPGTLTEKKKSEELFQHTML